MLKVNTPIARETMVLDPETGKPIVLKLDPPGLMLGLRTKQSKQTYMIPILDVYMAAKQAKGDDYRISVGAPPKAASSLPKAQPSSRELIVMALDEHKKLHFSQIRMRLKEKGLEISKRITGDILSMMQENGQVQQEGMYYSLKKSV